MTALRPATLDEYLTWLRAWLDAGNTPTHAYDYPWSQWAWLTATRDFRLGGECGVNAVHILVQPGIRHTDGGLGHNNLYFVDGTEQRGGTVPVFSDPVFEMLPGVREFIADERRKTAEWKRRRADVETARQLAAVDSDVPQCIGTSKDEGPDCRRCGKPTGKWWLIDGGTDAEHRMLCADCDAADMQRALDLPQRPVSSEEQSG